MLRRIVPRTKGSIFSAIVVTVVCGLGILSRFKPIN